MGPIWGRQDPGGPHVSPMNLAIWVYFYLGFLKHVTMRYSPRLSTYGIYARPFVQPRSITTFQLVLNMLNLPNYTCINSHRFLAGQIYMIVYSCETHTAGVYLRCDFGFKFVVGRSAITEWRSDSPLCAHPSFRDTTLAWNRFKTSP